MTSLSAVVEIEVQAPQALAFMHIVPIDLSSIFTGYGPLPSITGTHNQTGACVDVRSVPSAYLTELVDWSYAKALASLSKTRRNALTG